MAFLQALLLLLPAVQSADVNGQWKWSFERNGTQVETTLTLKLEGDKLSGTITGKTESGGNRTRDWKAERVK